MRVCYAWGLHTDADVFACSKKPFHSKKTKENNDFLLMAL